MNAAVRLLGSAQAIGAIAGVSTPDRTISRTASRRRCPGGKGSARGRGLPARFLVCIDVRKWPSFDRPVTGLSPHSAQR
jgi:hypothetical protein